MIVKKLYRAFFLCVVFATATATLSATANELHEAVRANNMPEIKRLIGQSPELLNSITESGMTPLHYAALHNRPEVAMLLVLAGAKLTEKTINGVTPLQLAFRKRSIDFLREMISKTSIVYTSTFIDASSKGNARNDKDFITELEIANDIVVTFLRNNPSNENINFANGMLCVALRDFSRASMAFERVLQINPKNDRARLELAHTYIETKQPGLAEEQLSIVMANNPSARLRQNIDAYFQQISKETKRWQFFARGDTAFFKDSNINVGPNSSIIDIAPIIIGSTVITNLTLSDASMPIDSDGYSAMFSASSGYDIGQKRSWLLTGDAAYYQSWLGNDNSDYENVFGILSLGVKKIAQKSILHLKTQATYINTGHTPLMNIYGINPAYLRVLNNSGTISLSSALNVELRDFDQLNYRDGSYYSIDETLKHYFGLLRNHSVYAGIIAAMDNADSDIYSYQKLGGKIGAEFSLPWQIGFYTTVSLSRSNYEGKDDVAPEDRSDNEIQFAAGFNRRINDHSGLDANYQATSNDSTFGLYKYNRDVTTISVYFMF